MRRLRRVIVALALAGGLSNGVAAQRGPVPDALLAQLQTRLDEVARRLDGVLGLAVLDLTTGGVVAARHEHEAFPTASAIKLAILYELMKQADEGTLAIDEPSPLDRSQVVGGSGVLQHLSNPVLSLRDHAALMIVVSDNTSTNVVIDAVGMERVTARMKGLGLADVRLRRRMMDGAAAKRGDENVASPAALARTAALLWRGEGLSQARRDIAVAMLRQVSGSIRRAVPDMITVASKTGTLDGVRAEAAVVDLPNRPFALAMMTTYLRHGPDGDRAIGEAADAIFSYFDRVASGGAYGRRIPN